jgi:hypothetical protein
MKDRRSTPSKTHWRGGYSFAEDEEEGFFN